MGNETSSTGEGGGGRNNDDGYQYEEPPVIQTREVDNDYIETFPITTYKRENILFIISHCHSKVYTKVKEFWSYFTKNPHLVALNYDYYLNTYEKATLMDVKDTLSGTNLDYNDFSIFKEHFIRLSRLKDSFVNGNQGNLDTLIEDINLFSKEKEDIDHNIMLISKDSTMNVVIQREYVGALVLWMGYRDLNDVINLKSMGFTMKRREARTGLDIKIYNERLAIAQIIGMSGSLMHFNLYTLDHAKNVLTYKVMNPPSYIVKENRRYLLRICLDLPGHYQILEYRKNKKKKGGGGSGIIIVHDFVVLESYIDKEKLLTDLYALHVQKELQFFNRPSTKKTKIEFKSSFYGTKEEEEEDYCIACGDCALLIEFDRIDKKTYCHKICQFAYHNRQSLYM